MTVRLYGINCPEMHGESKPAGEAAKGFTSEWMASHADLEGWVTLHTYKDRREKYGRYLGTILPMGVWGSGRSLNGALLDAGHAIVMID